MTNNNNNVLPASVPETSLQHSCTKISPTIMYFRLLTNGQTQNCGTLHFVVVSLTAILTLLTPEGDKHQFSPNKVNTQLREKVVRIDKMITKIKCFDLLSNSLNVFFMEKYRDQFGEFVCGYWGLKG